MLWLTSFALFCQTMLGSGYMPTAQDGPTYSACLNTIASEGTAH
jgi:hypothetical protein